LFSSSTLNIALGKVSRTVACTSMASSFDIKDRPSPISLSDYLLTPLGMSQKTPEGGSQNANPTL
jgi:hypothetical protein